MKKILGSAIAMVLFLFGFGYAETVTYKGKIQTIMAAKCVACHGDNAPTLEDFKKDKERFKQMMKGPRMDTYENLVIFVNGKDAGALMRRLDDGKSKADGRPGNMYQYLGSTEDERQNNLSVFKKWVGSWNLKKRAELTEEELNKITPL